MSWLQNLFGKESLRQKKDLESVRSKFAHFLALLDHNNRVLRIMADMEEKAQGEFLFDINYIQTCLEQVRAAVRALIEEMIALGGKEYLPLTTVYRTIDARIKSAMPGCRPVSPDGLTVPYDRLGRDRACSVGSKNAQLGELRGKLGLPVPDGFAISGWAYQRFLDHNELQVRISRRIDNLDIRSLETLVTVSSEIQDMILEAEVPSDVAEAIDKAADELIQRCGSSRFSLRSSAIGEDTMFSFAGQYATVLNLEKSDLIEQYLWIIASKFTPQAIYYYLSHSLLEHGLAMSVGCVEMIDARSSGVIYTRDPVRPHDDCVLINSIFGLGPYLVDGTLTPDIFCVSRNGREIGSRLIADKNVRLVLDKAGGTRSEDVPPDLRTTPSLSDDELRRLAELALQIERHYFSPQDIEWAINQRGQIYVLQSRPLHVIEPTPAQGPDVSAYRALLRGGSTVCPGAGTGPVHHVAQKADLPGVPDKAVIVTPHTFPGLITVMERASAIITATGGGANHMATVAREYRVPTLGGLPEAIQLAQGAIVTVDATQAVIYAGAIPELVSARRPEYELFADMAIFSFLEEVLRHVSPLNLIHPGDENFKPEACQTFHDITRLCHQRAMDEMFFRGVTVGSRNRISVELRSKIPLKVDVIYVDQEFDQYASDEGISRNN
jgi:pyruvate,water dikinase